MKLRIIFKPVDHAQDRSGHVPLAFVEIQNEDGEPINDPKVLEWIADGDYEAVIIDTSKI